MSPYLFVLSLFMDGSLWRNKHSNHCLQPHTGQFSFLASSQQLRHLSKLLGHFQLLKIQPGSFLKLSFILFHRMYCPHILLHTSPILSNIRTSGGGWGKQFESPNFGEFAGNLSVVIHSLVVTEAPQG
jgi:hypothetical protein